MLCESKLRECRHWDYNASDFSFPRKTAFLRVCFQTDTFLKLSKRLTQIDAMVASGYDHVWDCCCDHGFLGFSLLARNAAPHIHFVDIVPVLMETVNQKLQRYFENAVSAWTTHCIDVAALPLSQYQGKHLVIIAGVGGDLMMTFISAIRRRYPTLELDFLLCPVRHQFSLREHLISLEFSMLHEALVEENKRLYEVLLVSTESDAGFSVHPVGERFWQTHTPEQSKIASHYLSNTLNHYRRLQQSQQESVSHIVEAYQAVKLHDLIRR
ncbi:tRNA (adenine(22)-N(1))-methyltransferase [Enterovibrio norvegicus]|uniref:SAM-dependent methyltransferase n=1 Tax=Enterovibrio norvegicus TaxID=188144 RepID=A0A2N7LB19_9GAMM|nr:tRNA (adenine(22)-N(1))-methyltransferase TrmK [Enterovibrio norvegicus]PMN92333.1 SAM-dependent methyltransferase [Enterovibrio norvegicus]